MSLKQIVKGTVNNIMNNEQELFNKRIKICRDCKLYRADGIIAPICNPYLYLNPETNETSKKPSKGFYRGCGCVLGSKTRVKDAKCPATKW